MRRLVYIALIILVGLSSSLLAQNAEGEACGTFTDEQRERATERLGYIENLTFLFRDGAIEEADDIQGAVFDIQEWVTLSDSLIFRYEADLPDSHCAEYGMLVGTYDDLLGAVARLAAYIQTSLRFGRRGDTESQTNLLPLQEATAQHIDTLIRGYTRQYEAYVGGN